MDNHSGGVLISMIGLILRDKIRIVQWQALPLDMPSWIRFKRGVPVKEQVEIGNLSFSRVVLKQPMIVIQRTNGNDLEMRLHLTYRRLPQQVPPTSNPRQVSVRRSSATL